MVQLEDLTIITCRLGDVSSRTVEVVRMDEGDEPLMRATTTCSTHDGVVGRS